MKRPGEGEESRLFTLSRDLKTQVIFHAFATRLGIGEVMDQYCTMGESKIDQPFRGKSARAKENPSLFVPHDGSRLIELVEENKAVVRQQDGTLITAFLPSAK
jgi:hypothetical protein